jgi:hypothetical protein
VRGRARGCREGVQLLARVSLARRDVPARRLEGRWQRQSSCRRPSRCLRGGRRLRCAHQGWAVVCNDDPRRLGYKRDQPSRALDRKFVYRFSACRLLTLCTAACGLRSSLEADSPRARQRMRMIS